MRSDEYAVHDAHGLRELLVSRAVSSTEIEAVARESLEEANAAVNGLAMEPFGVALEHASDGPLSGIPFVIKDSGPMAKNVPFFCGSRALEGIVASDDSPLMKRVRGAGLVTLGLTTQPEFGASFATEPLRTGPTRNPWDLSRGAGGSSGGAAALVAAGAVPIAHGNDGAGSIRVPASCCGLVGLKPTRGRIPSGWDGPNPFGLTVEGVLTRSLRDTARFLDVMQTIASSVAEPRRLRVAWTARTWSGARVDPEVAAAAERTARVLDQLGHDVAEASPAVDWPAVIDVMHAGLVVAARPWLTPRRPPDHTLEAVTRQILLEADKASAMDLMAAFEAQHRLTCDVGRFFADRDLLITPTLGRPPAPHGTLRYDDPVEKLTDWHHQLFDYGPFTAVFNVTGQPAISLPLAHSHAGLPIGVQLVARHGAEATLLRTAAQLEAALPWQHRTPERATDA